MKTRLLSFFTVAAGYALMMSASVVGPGCGGSGSGGSGGSTGTGGAAAAPVIEPMNLVSDFEDLAAATVVMAGSPTRNGYWYTYNDDNPAGSSAGCTQTPKSGPQAMAAGEMPPTYIGTAPSTPSPGPSGGLALNGKWSGCAVWGAGIGADLNQPVLDGGTYSGPKVPYDLTPFDGITFWAMAVAGSDTALRIKLPMTDETKVEDGGLCVESATNKCSDDFGAKFNLPTNGTWKQITVRFSDATFVQEGWGAIFPWNPQHVTSIQIQSQNKGEPYDFFIDDMYFFADP